MNWNTHGISSKLILSAALLLLMLSVSFSGVSQNWPSGIHDPSSIVKDKDRYWVFGTGDGIYAKYSYDLVTWQDGPTPFQNGEFPQWILNYAKSNTDQFNGFFWAPDIIYMNGQYYLYYSCSVWGTTFSCIGLVINKTLDPSDPDYKWVDQGDIGIFSPRSGFQINAIDAAMMRGPDGRIWMTYGSFNRDGILVTEVDSVSGKPIGNTASVANSWTGGTRYGEGEGGCMIYRDGYYYMFYNKGGCCAGIGSSYYMVMGRSESPQGPFIDKAGKRMKVNGATSGGTVVFRHDDSRGEDDRYYGPGHFGYLKENDTWFVSFHYYDPNGFYPNEAVGNKGGPTQGLAFLKWDEEGWPSISMDFLDEGVYTLINNNSGKALDVENHAADSGALAFQYAEDPTLKTQKWYFKPLGTGEYTIQSFADNSLYLEAAAPGFNRNVQLTSNYTGAVNQKWRLVKDINDNLIIYPSTIDNILEVSSARTDDYKVTLWSNTNHATQRWTAEPIPSFFISQNEVYYNSDGSTNDTIRIVTDGIWDINLADDSWLSIFKTSGSGNATVLMVASNNNSEDERKTVLSITPETGSPILVYITQGGVEEPALSTKDLESIKLYPNPASTVVSVDAPVECQVRMFNQSGAEVAADLLPSKSKQIDIAHLPSGMYYLNIKAGNKSWVEKVVKR